ncbi:MAG: hypothetical protein OEL56_05295 [Nitrosopumilus sp.]|nr:hypothetical protein [Nitrosopumilus sp.]MDH3489845.1 hypothetical protein [Nitrosopumilus sp.]MDH3516668.1 hypothetical protein [Nitrosopumilus sp.]MDH3564676.1 hypothetical protein [Nitrosopumilus sp.]MDH5418329.1 hypothetical protein [Nitrosopumilus sp.]
MNKTLKYMAILALVPLFTAGMTSNYLTDANAATSNKVVCGDVLCKNYPGGRNGWEEDKKSGSSTVTPQPAPQVSKEVSTQKEVQKNVEPKTTSQKNTESSMDSQLKLSRANVPATIPLHQGYYNGEDVYFIITDSSDPTHADIITANQDWKVELAPLLANAPAEALSKTYMFTNGIKGDGVHGFQGEVFTSTPAQPEVYSALTSHVHVTWNEGIQPRVLDSQEMIMAAADKREVTLTELKVVLNMPQIVWPGGQMMVKENKTLTDETPYGGGQVLDINTEEKTVTFIAHRGWGPDGRTIYYIVTDATPSGPASMMGVTSAPTSASLIANSAAVDLFQFKDGLTGTGPMGFQPGIAAGAPGDANYSPMWRIFMIGWTDPSSAQLLETIDDINAYKEADLIDISIAKPMDSDHIVNCPFIDPFQ